MQKRDIVVAIILSIVTCGIYTIFWYYSLADDIGRLEGKSGEGGKVLLYTIITCGIYGFIFLYRAGGVLEKYNGKNDGILYIVLSLFGVGIVSYALIQNELNAIVDGKGMGGPGNGYDGGSSQGHNPIPEEQKITPRKTEDYIRRDSEVIEIETSHEEPVSEDSGIKEEQIKKETEFDESGIKGDVNLDL